MSVFGQQGHRPAPRAAHAGATIGSKGYIYGGRIKVGYYSYVFYSASYCLKNVQKITTFVIHDATNIIKYISTFNLKIFWEGKQKWLSCHVFGL